MLAVTANFVCLRHERATQSVRLLGQPVLEPLRRPRRLARDEQVVAQRGQLVAADRGHRPATRMRRGPRPAPPSAGSGRAGRGRRSLLSRRRRAPRTSRRRGRPRPAAFLVSAQRAPPPGPPRPRPTPAVSSTAHRWARGTRRPPQRPGDVVQQQLAAAEDQRRPHDRVREPRPRARAPPWPWPGNSRTARPRRVRDAELDDPADPRASRAARRSVRVLSSTAPQVTSPRGKRTQ